MGVTIVYTQPIPGPKGDTGEASTVPGPKGDTGPQGEGIELLNAAAPITYNQETKTIAIDTEVTDGGNF